MAEDSTRQSVGLDLGDQFSVFCIMDGGEVVEEGRLRTTSAALSGFLSRLSPSVVVMEVGQHSPWVSRLVPPSGHRSIVLNTHRVRLIAESLQKNDRNDAETLAFLGQLPLDQLAQVRHRSEQTQADLALIRGRAALVRCRTMLINHARGAAKAVGHKLPACDARSFPAHVGPAVPDELRPALYPLLEEVAALTNRIHDLDRALEEVAQERYPETTLLRQVPGVGPLIALTFVLTLADPERFERSRQVGAYLGLVPRQHESSGRSRDLGITHAGDHHLRQLLVQGAHYVIGPRGPDTDLRRWALAQLDAKGPRAKKRIVIAVARKLAVLLHRLWVTGAVYHRLREEEGVMAV